MRLFLKMMKRNLCSNIWKKRLIKDLRINKNKTKDLEHQNSLRENVIKKEKNENKPTAKNILNQEWLL